MTRLLILVVLLIPALAPRASAQALKERVQARLVSEHPALVPGRTFYLGLTFTIDPDWHIYWLNPGDSGLPVEIDLGKLPEGIKVGEPLWPAPHRYEREEEFVDFVHTDQVTVLLPVMVAPEVELGSRVSIKARVSWLVCREACIPGSASCEITLPVAEEAGKATAEAPLFAATRNRLPTPAPKDIKVAWKGLKLTLRAPGAERVAFFPWLPDEIQPPELFKSCLSRGEALEIPYPERIREAGEVKGLLEVRRAGKTSFHWITVATPRKADRS